MKKRGTISAESIPYCPLVSLLEWLRSIFFCVLLEELSISISISNMIEVSAGYISTNPPDSRRVHSILCKPKSHIYTNTLSWYEVSTLFHCKKLTDVPYITIVPDHTIFFKSA